MQRIQKAGHPHLKLINEIFTLFSDNMTCVSNWGFYMFSPEFDEEAELRNRIGAIWVSSLLDALEAEQRVLARLRAKTKSLGEEHLQLRCEDAAVLVEAVAEVIRRYTSDEQLFLADYRNQMVHSWLARRHGEVTTVKYFDGKEFTVERLAPQELANRIAPLYEAGPLHNTLESLLARFRDMELRYWHVVVELSRPGVMDVIYDAMFVGRDFPIESLREPVTGPAEFTIEPPRKPSSSSSA